MASTPTQLPATSAPTPTRACIQLNTPVALFTSACTSTEYPHCRHNAPSPARGPRHQQATDPWHFTDSLRLSNCTHPTCTHTSLHQLSSTVLSPLCLHWGNFFHPLEKRKREPSFPSIYFLFSITKRLLYHPLSFFPASSAISSESMYSCVLCVDVTLSPLHTLKVTLKLNHSDRMIDSLLLLAPVLLISTFTAQVDSRMQMIVQNSLLTLRPRAILSVLTAFLARQRPHQRSLHVLLEPSSSSTGTNCHTTFSLQPNAWLIPYSAWAWAKHACMHFLSTSIPSHARLVAWEAHN